MYDSFCLWCYCDCRDVRGFVKFDRGCSQRDKKVTEVACHGLRFTLHYLCGMQESNANANNMLSLLIHNTYCSAYRIRVTCMCAAMFTHACALVARYVALHMLFMCCWEQSQLSCDEKSCLQGVAGKLLDAVQPFVLDGVHHTKAWSSRHLAGMMLTSTCNTNCRV